MVDKKWYFMAENKDDDREWDGWSEFLGLTFVISAFYSKLLKKADPGVWFLGLLRGPLTNPRTPAKKSGEKYLFFLFFIFPFSFL